MRLNSIMLRLFNIVRDFTVTRLHLTHYMSVQDSGYRIVVLPMQARSLGILSGGGGGGLFASYLKFSGIFSGGAGGGATAFRLRPCQCLQVGRLCWRGQNPDLRQYASRVSCFYGFTVVYEMSSPLNQQFKKCPCYSRWPWWSSI